MSSTTDPSQSTSDEFNRRAFLGLSSAVAIGGALSAKALAADMQLGTTHTPLVAENDPAIVVEHVKLARPDVTIAAYAASPKNANETTPVLVVVMHIWGVDTSIRDVVRRYAKAGYRTIAPDLFARFNAPSGDGTSDINLFRGPASQLKRDQYSRDIRAAYDWAHARSSKAKAGVTGFCMGGHITLEQAIDNADVFALAAPFYGDVKGIDPAQIRMPICGSYGARDTSIPADSVRAFSDSLKVPHDIKIYDEAGHAFFDDQRQAYVMSAADDAWHRVLAFYQKYVA